MKYCLECGRELFDRDMVCDRCNSINLIDSKTCEKIVNEINSANKISLKFLLRDRIYKQVYDLLGITDKRNVDVTGLDDESVELVSQLVDKVQQYISKLSNQQVNILNLLIDGYTPKDIRQILEISSTEYAENMKIMRSFENVKILF